MTCHIRIVSLNNSEVTVITGTCYIIERFCDVPNGEACVRRALSLRPNDKLALVLLAQCHEKRGDLRGAVRRYAKLAHLFPEEPALHLHRALTLLRLTQVVGDAVHFFSHSIALRCLLHCIVLYIALHYILHCVALHFTLHCIAFYIALHCILHCIALHFTLHCIALALHFTLHLIA